MVFLWLHVTLSVLSLCRLIWRHWTYKMIVRYFIMSVCRRLINSLNYLVCNIYRAVRYELTHFFFGHCENMCTLCYCNHQTGIMNHQQLFGVNVMRQWCALNVQQNDRQCQETHTYAHAYRRSHPGGYDVMTYIFHRVNFACVLFVVVNLTTRI